MAKKMKTLKLPGQEEAYEIVDAYARGQIDAHIDADNHAPSNAQANVIETIKVNNVALQPDNKTVNITIPTDYLTANDITGKADKDTTLAGYGITNAYTKDEVDNILKDKQDTLTFDSTPTSNSTNPVTSGGVYSALSGKQETISGGASTITSSNLTINRALISNGSGKVDVSAVTSTELGYLVGVTSNIQEQLDNHTHNYAGSSIEGGAANSANKLNTDAGDENTPVYFVDGVPVACASLDLDTTGNAATATKATKDASGNVITSTYMTKTNPTGTGSFSLNRKANTTIGAYSFAEGYDTTASASYSHAEGRYTTASGNYSHAEGFSSRASASYSHAEGRYTIASGQYSHAEGLECQAQGSASHAEGDTTIAASDYQHVQGKFNIEDGDNVYAHIVGNGTDSASSNAHTIDWSGNAWFAGDVYAGSTSGTNKDEGSLKLATVTYVDELIGDIGTLLDAI